MSKISCRGLAVLTVVALASFNASAASGAAGLGPEFRDSPAWSRQDDVITLIGEPSRDNFLSTRGALADSMTSLEFRAPQGAHADLYVQGRYGVRARWHRRLAERGHPVSRAAHGLRLQQDRQCTDARGARGQGPAPQRGVRQGQRGRALGWRGFSRPPGGLRTGQWFCVAQGGPPAGRLFGAHRAQGFGRRHQRKRTDRLGGAGPGDFSCRRLRGLPYR